MNSNSKLWDIFVSHASEDKNRFVRPLAESLHSLGVSIWYDEFTLIPGDSLSRSIDKGLIESKYGLVIISSDFINKPWPEHELRGLVAREIDEDKVIIPIWLGVTRSEVISFSPPLADKVAIIAESLNAEQISIQVLRAVRPDIYKSKSRGELHKIANGEAIQELQIELERAKKELEETKELLSEYQCPFCNAPISIKIEATADHDEKHWDVREIYECGYICFGGYVEQLCPSDPNFPAFENYELRYRELSDEPNFKWECTAFPKTEAAKKLSLQAAYGDSKEKTKQIIYEKYTKFSTRYDA